MRNPESLPIGPVFAWALLLALPTTALGTTPSVCLVRDAVKGEGPQSPVLTPIGDISKGTLFAATDEDALAGTLILWITDPVAGARPLAALCTECWASAGSAVGDVLFFKAQGTWRTDGTVAGTWRIPDYPPVMARDAGEVVFMTAVVGKRFLSAECDDGALVCNLWYVEASSKAWKPLASLNEGTYGGNGSVAPQMVGVGADVFVLAYGSLWRVNALTGILRLVWQGPEEYGSTDSLTLLPNRLVWRGHSADWAYGVWSYGLSDGKLRLLSDTDLQISAFRSSLVALDKRAYLWLHDDVEGTEVWSTDGSTPLRRETDFVDQRPQLEGKLSLARAGSAIVFAAKEVSGIGFYALTGSGRAPRLLHGGCAGCSPSASGSSSESPLVVTTGGRAVFIGGEPSTGWELWSTDGTVAGTRQLLDQCPGNCGTEFVALHRDAGGITVGTRVTQSGSVDTALWTTDGTASGTYSIGPLPQVWPLSRYDPLVEAQVLWNPWTSRYVYAALFPEPGLYAADPRSENAATPLIRTRKAALGANPVFLTAFEGGLVFEQASANSTTSWWSVSGSPARLHKLAHGRYCQYECVNPFGRAGARFVYFRDRQLWSGDGKANGGVQLTFESPGILGSPHATASFASWHDLALTAVGEDLWLTDGTVVGTRHFRLPGVESTFWAGEIRILADLGDEFYFAVADRYSGPFVWRSDGTEAGTTRLAEPRRTQWICSLSSVGGQLIAGVVDTAWDREQFAVWLRDADQETWRLLGKLDGESTCLGSPTVHDGALYFFRWGPTELYGEELLWRLWRVGPDVAPIRLAEGHTRVSEWWKVGPNLVSTTDGVYWAFEEPTSGSELWFSDGTALGTRVRDLFPGSYGSRPTDLTATALGLFFGALSPSTGRDAWRIAPSSGEGPMPMEVSVGPRSSAVAGFTAVGDRVYFAATRPDVGRELFYWSPNGCGN